MSTAVTVTYNPNGIRELAVATWAALANGEAGTAVNLGQYADKSVQIRGTFGAAGSVQLEGSNDGTNYELLTDPQGNDIVKTAADLEQVSENPLWIRPRCTAGDGTTNLQITLTCKR